MKDDPRIVEVRFCQDCPYHTITFADGAYSDWKFLICTYHETILQSKKKSVEFRSQHIPENCHLPNFDQFIKEAHGE